MESKKPSSLSEQSKTAKKKSVKPKAFGNTDTKEEVLLNLPAGLKYRMPGKRQRVAIGSIVVGLNFLFVLGVVLYFYSPAFQQFVYNFGR
tara:strand:+ start:1206 stop:1475 length:270 start_codon:yes stop_codon:yes gene_type:complete